MLAYRFENMKMMENEIISDFNSKLCNIANEAFDIGEKYSDTTCEKEIKVTTQKVCLQNHHN